MLGLLNKFHFTGGAVSGISKTAGSHMGVCGGRYDQLDLTSVEDIPMAMKIDK